MGFRACLLASLLSLLVLAQLSAAHSQSYPNVATQVAQFLTGSFSTEWQSLTDDSFTDARHYGVRIWHERTDGHWLYVEQTLSSVPNRPFRQRVYHVRYNGTVALSSFYRLPDQARFVGAWKTPWVLRGAATTLLPGCDVYFARVDANTIKGRNVARRCKSRLRGANYSTTVISLDPFKFLTLTRGFDVTGKQVWGSKNVPFEYNRIEKPY
eukprot:IDg7157t1